MNTDESPASRKPLGPHCRALKRGVLGDGIDGRSREGKFLRMCEAELVASVGGAPNFAQKMLIRRSARALLRLELLDEKMSSGNWTDHDSRTFGGLNNALRLALRELGVAAKSGGKPVVSLADIVARHAKPGNPSA